MTISTDKNIQRTAEKNLMDERAKLTFVFWAAVIGAKKHKRQSVTAKREKSQTPKFITAIQT